MLASVLIHWLGANFPHHSPEMTTATWQTVVTWPSCCPNSLGAPVFHGTWFFSFIILSPREDLVPLETAEKCGVCNYPASRSPVTGGGRKAEKKKKKKKTFFYIIQCYKCQFCTWNYEIYAVNLTLSKNSVYCGGCMCLYLWSLVCVCVCVSGTSEAWMKPT